MTREDLDLIGSMNMCDEISNEAYKKIVCHCREQEPCEDAVSRQAVCDYIAEFINNEYSSQAECEMVDAMIEGIQHLPSVKPQYTEDEIQKMQDLEQAEIEKAYQLGKAEGQECEDAISRQAALKKLKESAEHHANDSREEALLRRDRDIIRALPSVNPQPKTGHWIFDEILDKHYYCSECKSMGVDYWDFCPNCGARMVEPQESEDKE